MLTPGHDVTLTETNRRAWLPVCACGWYGAAHYGSMPPETEQRPNACRISSAQDAARAEHEQHCHDVRVELAGRTWDTLGAAAKSMDAVRGTLTRRGRFGHS